MLAVAQGIFPRDREGLGRAYSRRDGGVPGLQRDPNRTHGRADVRHGRAHHRVSRCSVDAPQEINWIVVPLLIIFYAGELVWREREARLSEIDGRDAGAGWVLFVGKFPGLSLVLVALQALMMAAGMLTQMLLGYYDLQVELYAQTLFGLQLVDYLLFALLALVVHTLVNHKYVGHLVVVIAYALMTFGPALGLEHNLLIYGSDPGWMYSDMRGFEPFIEAWLWFKLYWAAWALLLAVAATLFWVRGTETGFGSRLALARRRFSRRAAGVAAATAALILTLGGFIFYNTNVLNAYHTASDGQARRAEYERRYGQYKGIPQPQLTGVKLQCRDLSRAAGSRRSAARSIS